MNNFSEILNDLRKEKNVTQKELAKACGVSSQCICSLEQGTNNPTGSTIKALAIYFDVSADYLLGLHDDEQLNPNIPYSAPVLTDEEKDLLDTFRAIPDNTKGVALTMLHSLAPAKKEKSTLNKRA